MISLCLCVSTKTFSYSIVHSIHTIIGEELQRVLLQSLPICLMKYFGRWAGVFACGCTARQTDAPVYYMQALVHASTCLGIPVDEISKLT